MTRAQTHTQGLVTPPPIQLLLEAALRAFVSLVQGVATTLGMIFKRNRRDWHTTDAREALPQAKDDIHIKETHRTNDPEADPLVHVPREGGIQSCAKRRFARTRARSLTLTRPPLSS